MSLRGCRTSRSCARASFHRNDASSGHGGPDISSRSIEHYNEGQEGEKKVDKEMARSVASMWAAPAKPINLSFGSAYHSLSPSESLGLGKCLAAFSLEQADPRIDLFPDTILSRRPISFNLQALVGSMT